MYKTGQTRGADDDDIFQNRVARTSTVLIRHSHWGQCRPTQDHTYERGYIVLVEPSWYFEQDDADADLAEQGLALGTNALLFYQRRSDWQQYPPNAAHRS